MPDDDETSSESSTVDETQPQSATTDEVTTQSPGGQRVGRAPTLTTKTGERYRLGAEIGHGGMGEILAATDDQIGREVVVKRMKERKPSDHAIDRFFREACIQGRLDHPAIVPVHELGVDDDGRPFFTMKRLTGVTLAKLIELDHPRQRLLRAFADICLAIEFAHTRGVLHRDIKPQNIVLGDFGEVYMLDWGVAKLLTVADEPLSGPDGLDSDESFTLAGTMIGSRGYMAPEQAASASDLDGRADVYSLGCVLYEILGGEPLYRHPRDEDDDDSGSRPSTWAPHRAIPPELDELCARATARDRALRIATPRALGEAVQRFLDGDRDLAQRAELAREQLIEAKAAFIRGDGEEERRIAMRAAGRALALDPTLAGAGELVTRLMLEPPRERPPEVQQLIDVDNLETLRRQARSGALGYLGFLAFLPIFFTGDRPQLGYAVLLAALVALNCALLVSDWSYRDLRARPIRIAIGNVLLIAAVARIASPFLFAPGVAALSITVIVFSPAYQRSRSVIAIVAAMSVAVLAVDLAETAGWISSSTELVPHGVTLTPPLLALSDGAKHAVLVLSAIGLIGAAGGIAFANRRAERLVRDRLHMQAWQLRQLVS